MSNSRPTRNLANPDTMARAASSKSSDLSDVFAALKQILRVHSKSMKVEVDAPRSYHLRSNAPHPSGKGFIAFGAVKINARYVSLHLMPIYVNPSLARTISPGLRSRMQGKACFNFQRLEPELFREVAALTEAGARCFKRLKRSPKSDAS